MWFSSESDANQPSQSQSDKAGEQSRAAQRPVREEEVPHGCSLVCCRGETLYQARDRDLIKKTARTQSGRTRYFNPAWDDTHSWLTLCTSSGSGKAFCSVCREQKSKGRLSFSRNQDPAFLTTGFNNWKEASLRFQKHEAFKTHREACEKAVAAERSKDSNRGAVKSRREDSVFRRRWKR